MSIDLTVQYPGKIGPATADYPYGEPRNITAPSDGTGTPWEAAIVKDTEGFKQALLKAAGIVPSGTPDKATDSEYLKAILSMISSQTVNYVDSGAANVYVVDPDTNKQGPALLTAGLEVTFTPANDNTGASTIDVNGLGAIAILNGLTGNPLQGGLNKGEEIVAGESITLTYDGVNWLTDGASGYFVPTVEGSTTAGAGWVYTTSFGYWRKSGKIINIGFSLGVTTIGAGAAGSVYVKGMPTLVGNDNFNATNFGILSTNSFNNTGGRTNFIITPLSTSLIMQESGGGVTKRDFLISDMPVTFGLQGSITVMLK